MVCLTKYIWHMTHVYIKGPGGKKHFTALHFVRIKFSLFKCLHVSSWRCKRHLVQQPATPGGQRHRSDGVTAAGHLRSQRLVVVTQNCEKPTRKSWEKDAQLWLRTPNFFFFFFFFFNRSPYRYIYMFSSCFISVRFGYLQSNWSSPSTNVSVGSCGS